MKKIGVLAEDFNPINLEHISFLKLTKEKFNLDEIIIIPISQNKEISLNNISNPHKKSMCDIAIKNLGFVKLYKKEVANSQELLKILKNLKTDININLFLIAWPKSLNYYGGINKIYSSCDIVKLAKIISLTNSKNILNLRENFPQIEFKDCDIYLTNARKIRISIALQKNLDLFLNSDLLSYINLNNLYKNPESIFLECYDVCKFNNSKKRFTHCTFVAKAAQMLAKHYNENEYEAKIAGILHDVLKEKNKDYMLRIFKTYDYSLTKTQKINPKVWHGIAGAIYMEKILGLENSNIINAIKYHTVPRKNMTLFEKIIFMADRISEDRKYKDVQFLRDLAKVDLNSAVLYSLKNTISSILKKENTISIPTIECYNELIFKKRGI